jgi:hypothetical protein
MVPKCLNHSTKASEIFCFEDNCCLCSVCALLKHKDHDILDINEATKRIQKEIMSFSTKEEIKIIEESIEKINKEISKRNEKFEKDLENLKEDHMKDLDVLGDSKLKLQENLNTLKEFESNLKSFNILTLLKMNTVEVLNSNLYNLKLENEVEPVNQSCTSHSKQTIDWTTELQFLKEMGFSDTQKNIQLLEQHKGEITSVVQILVSS